MRSLCFMLSFRELGALIVGWQDRSSNTPHNRPGVYPAARTANAMALRFIIGVSPSRRRRRRLANTILVAADQRYKHAQAAAHRDRARALAAVQHIS